MFPYFAIYRNLSLSSRIQSQQQLCNGASYSGFLNTKKINHAQKLLLNTQMSMVDIAVECGFSNSHYFSDVFKKIIGIPPLKYRKLYAKN